MPLLCLIQSEEWDFPFFKKLANNDTSTAKGHQGGIVIPKELRIFFPQLSESITSAQAPTTDQRIEADLFVEDRFLETVSTRYQFQTWGGTRSAESRLTDQLSSVRDLAKGGDILILQRNSSSLNRYRLTLVRQSSTDFHLIESLIGNNKWGVLGSAPPMTQVDLEDAINAESAREHLPFTMIDESAQVSEIRSKKVARSVAFREIVCGLYSHTCAVCGTALKSPLGTIEVDAAHIVPRSRFGADDARNGIALCKRHHWAFDFGLFGINSAMQILVPKHVSAIPQNEILREINGSSLLTPKNPLLAPHPEALEWHRHNILLKP